MLGVREETVSGWEKDRGRPLARHHGAIIRFLGFDPSPAAETLAGRLRATRLWFGLTQEQMAQKLGLDEGSVCSWESGSRRPNRWMAGRVDALLDAVERGDGEPVPAANSTLNFFDLTRWRRRPPSGLLSVKPATLGDRLRSRRLELGLSQEQAGRRFGVGRVTFYRWERGEPPPRRAHRKIHRFLKGADLPRPWAGS
jgi:transcriptional regulator with XRE-family HTH domain